jgi:hypothetical protein
MQRHCGEHMLSGTMDSLFGGVNKGFHMGDEYITIDIDLGGRMLTDEELELAERTVNEAIWADLPVTVTWFDDYESSLALPVRKKVPHIGKVSVVTVGEIEVLNSTSIIVAEKFKALIAELKNEFDYVLIVCAPISSSSDYINLSFLIDGAIFLVAHGETKKERVEIAVKELRKNGVNILGSVFTKYKKNKDLGCNYYTEM